MLKTWTLLLLNGLAAKVFPPDCQFVVDLDSATASIFYDVLGQSHTALPWTQVDSGSLDLAALLTSFESPTCLYIFTNRSPPREEASSPSSLDSSVKGLYSGVGNLFLLVDPSQRLPWRLYLHGVLPTLNTGISVVPLDPRTPENWWSQILRTAELLPFASAPLNEPPLIEEETTLDIFLDPEAHRGSLRYILKALDDLVLTDKFSWGLVDLRTCLRLLTPPTRTDTFEIAIQDLALDVAENSSSSQPLECMTAEDHNFPIFFFGPPINHHPNVKTLDIDQSLMPQLMALLSGQHTPPSDQSTPLALTRSETTQDGPTERMRETLTVVRSQATRETLSVAPSDKTRLLASVAVSAVSEATQGQAGVGTRDQAGGALRDMGGTFAGEPLIIGGAASCSVLAAAGGMLTYMWRQKTSPATTTEQRTSTSTMFSEDSQGRVVPYCIEQFEPLEQLESDWESVRV